MKYNPIHLGNLRFFLFHVACLQILNDLAGDFFNILSVFQFNQTLLPDMHIISSANLALKRHGQCKQINCEV